MGTKNDFSDDYVFACWLSDLYMENLVNQIIYGDMDLEIYYQFFR